MAERKININIQDGTEFFSHEAGINFNPEQFIFDFRSVTPRIDPRTKDGPTIIMKHNVVMVSPYHAKRFKEMLDEAIGKYEKDFGTIDKPKAVQKFEKKIKKQKPSDKKEGTVVPSYFG